MGRIILIFALLHLVCTADAGSISTEDKRAALIETAQSQIGVREATGHNDGVQVELYLEVSNLKRGNPWCAAFVAWCFKQCSIAAPISAYCPDWFKKNVVYKRGVTKSFAECNVRKGDVFGIYFPELKRIAHEGLIESIHNDYITTVEGNTNDMLSREGDGVYRKRRQIRQVYAVADYIN